MILHIYYDGLCKICLSSLNYINTSSLQRISTWRGCGGLAHAAASAVAHTSRNVGSHCWWKMPRNFRAVGRTDFLSQFIALTGNPPLLS